MAMDPTHLHLLLNHFPTVGFVMGLGLFIVALIARSDHLKQAGLVIFVGIALLTIPTYVTGNAAYDAIQSDPNVSSTLVNTHEGAAFLALVVIQLTGALAWLALWKVRRVGRLSGLATTVVLLFALLAMGLVARAANLGGEVRHTEIRAAQEAVTAEGPLARIVGDYVRDTPWVWVTAETLHFVGLSLLIGVLILVDLRMLGFMKQLPTSVLTRLLPWGMLGFAINTMTGMLFFVGAPGQYLSNPAFFWKLVFILAGGANVVYFTFDPGWDTDTGRAAPALSKVVAVSAIVLWVGVMYWGSMLPFIGNAF